MATLKAIRKRIGSIRNTQQITKAMKMVSAAKLRRAQEAAVAARPYAEKMIELLKNVGARVSSEAHPLLRVREERKLHLVLFTSDRGLCGGYNANLIRAAEAFMRKNAGDKEIELTLVGRKGADYFRRRRANIADRHIGILATPAEELAAEIAQKLINRFVVGAVAGADAGKAFAGRVDGSERDGGTTTNGIPLRARSAGTPGEPPAADYRGGGAAGAVGGDRQRAWRAHDGDGFGNQQRVQNDGQLDLADEPGASSFDHPRADGNRRHGGSVEVRN
jgi:hypothetical protein